MDLVMGAMDSLLPKLAELLNDEYKLPKRVKEGIRSLEKEMTSMRAALRVVAEVPQDQLDEQVKLWAGEVRELSFDMEDVVDKFLVRVDDSSEPAANSNKRKRLMENSEPVATTNKLKLLIEKMANFFPKWKARHQIADAIKDINKQVQEIANRHGRYTIDNIVARPAAVTTIDPRLRVLYTEVTELVGIAGKRDQELMKLLSEGDSMSKKKLKIVSVVGFGGLGKTTLVKTVYDKIKGDFDSKAFVPAGRNAGAKKVLMDILLDLGIKGSELTMLDERQLIDKLREILENKRYLIVIDDIWEEKLWTVINLAFSNSNNFGSRLITTTRIVTMSKLCCSSTNGCVYPMEPLSDDDSQRLFYKRIFSHEGGCPHEFEEVSNDILRKCGGVPLAIITIASLLASDNQVKHVDEWRVLLKCIGRGLTEDPSAEEMLRILSFSYYDLPSHLKTCLLYLSIFPEDYRIEKDRLIWMFIAESFVQCEKQKTSLFDIGETYFNELLNRNMIMPVYDDEGIIVACRVHDMVLDLLSSLSTQDNFVTVLNGIGDVMSPQGNVRRLSLQNARKVELHTTPLESVSMLQVRSVAAFEPAIGLMPSLSRFVVLRVLELKGCDLGYHNHLNLRELGSLLHLRYLGLGKTKISELPERVGKLQFLQVLDLSGNDDVELPSTIIKLRRLMCLLIDFDHKRLPDGLGNLTSMEVLGNIDGDSLSTVKELGSMERLRELVIRFGNLSLELVDAFVESLGKMSNIQKLRIGYGGDPIEVIMDILGERWVAPRSLREFSITGYIQFSTLPAWIRLNPSHLSQLSSLRISIKKVRQEDLDVLGRLPALRILSLWSPRQSRLLLVAADGFRCLTVFNLVSDSPGQVVFQPGAMPKAEIVGLRISLQVAKVEASAGNGSDRFDLGMGNLPSLRQVYVTFFRMGVTVGEARQVEMHDFERDLEMDDLKHYFEMYDVTVGEDFEAEARQVEAALEKALCAHPNQPGFHIDFAPYIPAGAGDDDVCNTDDESD